VLNSLLKHGLKLRNPDFDGGKEEKRPLDGLSLVITGALPAPRKEVEDLIDRLGGHASSSVSKSTSYLIVGEEPGSKLEKAQALGVKTISYDELMKLIGERTRKG
jgi:DNA ligase (NAD+)